MENPRRQLQYIEPPIWNELTMCVGFLLFKFVGYVVLFLQMANLFFLLFDYEISTHISSLPFLFFSYFKLSILFLL